MSWPQSRVPAGLAINQFQGRECVDWYRARRYLHFDQPIGLKRASQIVTKPDKVAAHSFFPFLHYEILSKKVRKINGKLEPNPKSRPIKFAAHLDSHIYSYYCHLLSQPYEKILIKEGLTDSVLAFRKLGKSNIDFAKDAFLKILQTGGCTAIAYDITGFFDHIDHKLLKCAWCKLLGLEILPTDHYAVFKSLTKFSYVERSAVYQELGISENNPHPSLRRICTPRQFREEVRKKKLIKSNVESFGIPQGSPISAFLSNIYMLDFDLYMTKAVEEQGGAYYRYCDDMLFVVPTEFRNTLSSLVIPEIEKLKLKINEAKTEICDFQMKGTTLSAKKPLQYLGFLFDGQRILLRSVGLARYSERMNRGVRRAKNDQLKFNTIRMRKGQSPTALFKRKLYEKYSHLGRRNFVTYGFRAAVSMNSKAIRRQLKPLWIRLKNNIDKP